MMRVTHYDEPGFDVAYSHDPKVGVDILTRRYDDGATSVLTRPTGTGQPWSPLGVAR